MKLDKKKGRFRGSDQVSPKNNYLLVLDCYCNFMALLTKYPVFLVIDNTNIGNIFTNMNFFYI